MRVRVWAAFALCLAGSGAIAAPLAKLDSGVVVGLESGQAAIFRAIPYAAPPTGPLRWKPPGPAIPWIGERHAAAPGPACPQMVGAAPNLGGYFGPISEDCLTLDVTAPKVARHAPVMVWIYGGGNVAGSTNLPSYDATNFARDGVMVVAMNYRLGALGFLAHPALSAEAPGDQPLASYGIMDQIAALKWVKRNIAAFGGDPGNVTLFGESAGGEDVLALLTLPAAKGLFQRAIVQSGGGWSAMPALADREAEGAALASRLGLPGASATTAQLRALSVNQLLDQAGPTGQTVDGRLFTQSVTRALARGAFAPVPLIIGSNSNEASLMLVTGQGAREVFAGMSPGLRAAYAADAPGEGTLARADFNDRVMGGPARWVARMVSIRAPAWLYYFSYVPERQRGVRPGVNHASEIPFVFDSLDAIPGRTPLITPSERAAAAFAHVRWVAFARHGRPDRGAGPAWPAYRTDRDRLLDFGDPPTVRTHFRKAQLDAQEAVAAMLIAPR